MTRRAPNRAHSRFCVGCGTGIDVVHDIPGLDGVICRPCLADWNTADFTAIQQRAQNRNRVQRRGAP